MPLKYVDKDTGKFKITNRMISSKDEAFQAITIMLRTDSPFAENATSLEGLVGYNDSDDASGDIHMRLKNIETVLQNEYDIKTLSLEELDFNESSQQYEITLILERNDGTTVKETINA